MVTALYRRYRPETFAELIGQSQVTEPLRTALRTNRVNHAYLFSGPRGCGKTTSARILARCLNCAEGPTDTPCGVCPSCVELARDGGGSLDVIEIDAASHNGVDDARDLRDRAIFAPARDRYKIFILDEAHMVTPQGFNALLKLVEEPPEHVKFVFATTEPEKVIGTIRSRTHHYPFRLVPPATMLQYVEELCEQESVTVAPGVLPLVVRAGGGSVRDTLSLLDQLMAGSEERSIAYDRAVALLGYTDGALIDDVVDALAVREPASVFTAIDRVIQTGQDPRRFVEDLLERLRDLIIVAATNEGAAAVLRGVSPDELATMSRQAAVFGAVALSRAADIANRSLTEMTGATSPRLHLELMVARMLVPESDDSQRGALARVERLERRIGVDAPSGSAGGAQSAGAMTPAPPVAPVRTPAAAVTPSTPVAPAPAPGTDSREPERTVPVAVDAAPAPGNPAPVSGASAPAVPPSAPAESNAVPAQGATPASPIRAVDLQQIRDSWTQVVEHVQRARRSAWTVVVTAQVSAFAEDVLTLTFPSQQDVASFKERSDPGANVSELLRAAILDVLGVRVKFVAKGPGSPASNAAAPAAVPSGSVAPRTDSPSTEPGAGARGTTTARAADAAVRSSSGSSDGAAVVTDWAVAVIPTGPLADETAPDTGSAPAPADAPATVTSPAAPVTAASPVTPAAQQAAAEHAVATAPGAVSDVSGSAEAPPARRDDYPIDDYPLEDDPYDPGPSDAVGAPRPATGASPAAQPAGSAQPPTPPSRAATNGSGALDQAAASAPAPSGPRVQRPPVPGRYGEAVVREILGAQFIEETALDDGRRA
ncbi:DNA polymerase III subunit gamma and tau [Curtobacterium ammoniigenes]|uniref:DNA polymerase III subunit gamma and tau n=1 Tax=Curtobacterium ammoniigenes TaxID=395387 RepID=UPI0008354FD8|nr:DNA polymerase III subunit gamma and tau [Curtobacterium ammoniigenes]